MSVFEMEFFGGEHLRDALRKAWRAATARRQTVSFAFNDKRYTVEPTDTYDEAKLRAEQILGCPILTAKEEQARAAAELERIKRESAEAIAAAGAPTEAEMRDAEVPLFKTLDELAAYIKALTERPHDSGTCVYAMSMASVAAFHYIAGTLGVTGFQASYADMDIIRRTRSMKHGLKIINYADLLYPQCWDEERAPVFEALLKDDAMRVRFATEARKLLAEKRPHTHPNVLRHWQALSEQALVQS